MKILKEMRVSLKSFKEYGLNFEYYVQTHAVDHRYIFIYKRAINISISKICKIYIFAEANLAYS